MKNVENDMREKIQVIDFGFSSSPTIRVRFNSHLVLSVIFSLFWVNHMANSSIVIIYVFNHSLYMQFMRHRQMVV